MNLSCFSKSYHSIAYHILLKDESKRNSMKRNLSKSFSNLIGGLRKNSLFSRTSTPPISTNASKTTTTSSKTSSLSSICSASICESSSKNKTKLMKKRKQKERSEIKSKKKLDLHQNLNSSKTSKQVFL